MLGLSKAQLDAAIAANTSDRQLAEYLLGKITFQAQTSRKFAALYGESKLEGVRQFSNEIDTVHHKLEQEIKENFEQPPIGEPTFNKVMFESEVREQLEKVNPGKLEFTFEM